MPTENNQTKTASGRIFQGTVVSAKMQKTVVVAVRRYVKHPKYGKYQVKTKRYLAHYDPPAGGWQYKEGDKVSIQETRPLSRHKSFVVLNSL